MNKLDRFQMLDATNSLSMRHQSRLLNISRSSFYYKNIINNESEIANLIMEIYLASDCRYGYRKITAILHKSEHKINHKRVLRLMNELKIEGLYPKRKINTSVCNITHKIYPYLLKDLAISYPNQVWATDITYIKLNDLFMYFVAIIDIYSRYIIAYDLSASLEISSCIYCVNQALKKAKPEIFNSDQGVQFTSNDFTKILLNAQIKISMDHKGRCFDNIFVERLWRTLKQESIYFYRPDNIKELEQCLDEFVIYYNNQRVHQSLNYKTPVQIYQGMSIN